MRPSPFTRPSTASPPTLACRRTPTCSRVPVVRATPAMLGPGADARRRRARRRPRRVHRRGRVRRQAGRDARGPDRRHAARQGRDPRRRRRRRRRSPPTACAAPRPRSRGARRKVASVATTLLDAAPDGSTAADAAQAVAEGMRARRVPVPRVQARRATPSKLAKVVLVGGGGAACSAALERGAAIADAVRWARDIVNEPSEAKSPADFAAAARKLLARQGRHGQGARRARSSQPRSSAACSASARARRRPPRFVKLTYTPPGAQGKALALVGKGVVFDSGGLSLKTAGRHGDDEDRHVGRGRGARGDVGAARPRREDEGHRLRAARREHAERHRDPPRRRAAASATARRSRCSTPTPRAASSSPTRSSLATEDKPDAIVDLATLTGACMVALGEKIAGLMGNDDELDRRRCATPPTGRRARCGRCRCPTEYRKLLDSEVADLKNIGAAAYGGALTAGLFLAGVRRTTCRGCTSTSPARARVGGDDGYLAEGRHRLRRAHARRARPTLRAARPPARTRDGRASGASVPSAAGSACGQAEVVVLGDDDRCRVLAARRALRVAPHLERAERLARARRRRAAGRRAGRRGRGASLIASSAWIEPTMPGSTPSTPASAQLGASSGGGGSGSRQR